MSAKPLPYWKVPVTSELKEEVNQVVGPNKSYVSIAEFIRSAARKELAELRLKENVT